MLGQLLGRALAGLVKGLVMLVVNVVVGLLKGLAMPFRLATVSMRRRYRRKRDVSALRRDWQAIRRGKVGKGGSNLGKRTRKRVQKRFSKLR